jgi:hypothetical protein
MKQLLPSDWETGKAIIETNDSAGNIEYFIIGYGSFTQSNNTDGFLLNISETGNLNYAKRIGNPGTKESCWAIVENSLTDLGILINTNIKSQNQNDNNVVIMKIPTASLETYTGVVKTQQIYGIDTIPEDAYFLTTIGYEDFATASETFYGLNPTSNIRFITTNRFLSYCADSSKIQIDNVIVNTSSLDEPATSYLVSRDPDITVVDADIDRLDF